MSAPPKTFLFYAKDPERHHKKGNTIRTELMLTFADIVQEANVSIDFDVMLTGGVDLNANNGPILHPSREGNINITFDEKGWVTYDAYLKTPNRLITRKGKFCMIDDEGRRCIPGTIIDLLKYFDDRQKIG